MSHTHYRAMFLHNHRIAFSMQYCTVRSYTGIAGHNRLRFYRAHYSHRSRKAIVVVINELVHDFFVFTCFHVII